MPFGITMLLSVVNPLNADEPISVTPSGMTYSVIFAAATVTSLPFSIISDLLSSCDIPDMFFREMFSSKKCYDIFLLLPLCHHDTKFLLWSEKTNIPLCNQDLSCWSEPDSDSTLSLSFFFNSNCSHFLLGKHPPGYVVSGFWHPIAMGNPDLYSFPYGQPWPAEGHGHETHSEAGALSPVQPLLLWFMWSSQPYTE